MNTAKNITSDENILFSQEEMGIIITEWDTLQSQIREKLFLHHSFFFPGNTPSLKNSKEILQIYNTKSTCCGAPVFRTKTGTKMLAQCTACKRPVSLKKPILGPSKPVREYRESYSGYFLANKPRFIMEIKKYSKPYIMGFYFVRDSRRRFDYINSKQIILDMMVQNGYMEDDDSDNVIDFSLGYHLDPKKAGCYVVLIPNTFFRSLINFI